MAKRKSLSKKLRFEVFKRDSFTCQYCGRKAPDVLLQVDHINPVAAAGGDDLLNLTTACFDCNSGKSDRLLSENSVLDKQRAQLEQLQERKEQIEMMFAWQKGLAAIKDDVIEELAQYWSEVAAGFQLNETGKKGLKKLERQFSLQEIMEAMRIAADTYIEFQNDAPTKESVEYAWKKVGGICARRREEAENPNAGRVYYIRGILRNRLSYCNEAIALDLLRQALQANASIDSLESHAKNARSWTQWSNDIRDYLESRAQDPASEARG